MANRIILDARLPADLDAEATGATGSDWLTIQKSGEAAMRRIRPVNAVPDLPASKITTGALDVARIPSLDAGKITTGTVALARLENIGTDNLALGAVSGHIAASTGASMSLTTSYETIQSLSFTPNFTGRYLCIAGAVWRHSLQFGTGSGWHLQQVDWVLYRAIGSGAESVLYAEIASAIGARENGFARGGGVSERSIAVACTKDQEQKLRLAARINRTGGNADHGGNAEQRRIVVVQLKR